MKQPAATPTCWGFAELPHPLPLFLLPGQEAECLLLFCRLREHVPACRRIPHWLVGVSTAILTLVQCVPRSVAEGPSCTLAPWQWAAQNIVQLAARPPLSPQASMRHLHHVRSCCIAVPLQAPCATHSCCRGRRTDGASPSAGAGGDAADSYMHGCWCAAACNCGLITAFSHKLPAPLEAAPPLAATPCAWCAAWSAQRQFSEQCAASMSGLRAAGGIAKKTGKAKAAGFSGAPASTALLNSHHHMLN